jgi:hypothetical protein
MSLSDRETAEGFAGGYVEGIATLDRPLTRAALPAEGFEDGEHTGVTTLRYSVT